MTHEILEPNFGITSSIMTIGIVVDIHEDKTVDISVNDTLHENIPVFYHCQKSTTSANGVYAFAVGDSAMVLHKDAIDFSNAVIIGFGDATLRLCRPPLIAGGYIDPSFENQTVGRCFAWYDGSNLTATPINNNGIHTEHTFFQVRYLPIPVSFNRVEIVDGATVTTVITHNMIISLAVHNGYILEFGPTDTIRNTVVVTFLDVDEFNVYRKVFNIDQNGTVDRASFSANFSNDFSELYIVHSVASEYLPEEPVSSVSVIVSTWTFSDNALSLDWSSVNKVISADYHCKYSFVDRAGLVWGFYRTELNGAGLYDYDYAHADIDTLNMTSTSKCSVGYTIDGGDFKGIFERRSEDEEVDRDESSGNYDNPFCALPGFVLYDDGLQLVDNSVGGCEGFPIERCISCPPNDEVCWSYEYIDQTWKYWFQRDFRRDIGDIKHQTVTVGDTTVTAETGHSYYGYTYTESAPKYKIISSCHCVETICVELTTTNVADNEIHDIDVVEAVNVVGGIISRYKDGITIYSTNKKNEPCTGACVCETPNLSTLVTDCNCAYMPGSMYTSIYWDRSYYECVANDIETDIADARTDIKFPRSIISAQPVSSSRAYDKNPGGLDIFKMDYYRITSGGTVFERILEIDGDDRAAEIYAATGFSEGNFHFLGFYF